MLARPGSDQTVSNSPWMRSTSANNSIYLYHGTCLSFFLLIALRTRSLRMSMAFVMLILRAAPPMGPASTSATAELRNFSRPSEDKSCLPPLYRDKSPSCEEQCRLNKKHFYFTIGMLFSQVRSSALSSFSPSPHLVEWRPEWRLRPWSLLRWGRSKPCHLIKLANKTSRDFNDFAQIIFSWPWLFFSL